MAARGVKGSFVHKCIWLPYIHENEIFCYRIFCPKSSIGRNYCLENMKQGEVRKLFTCTKLSSICIRMPLMGSSEGLRFDSSWGLSIFPLSHTHKGNISL